MVTLHDGNGSLFSKKGKKGDGPILLGDGPIFSSELKI
jgi:hypothetical protein